MRRTCGFEVSVWNQSGDLYLNVHYMVVKAQEMYDQGLIVHFPRLCSDPQEGPTVAPRTLDTAILGQMGSFIERCMNIGSVLNRL